jgi:hypothetical protein
MTARSSGKSPARAWASALLAAGALTGCSLGGSEQKLPPLPSPRALSHGADRARIQASFDTYNIALAKGDFAIACTRLAPETIAKATREAGVADCAAALRKLYAKSGKEAGKQLHDIATSAQIQRLDYDSPTVVTIRWLASVRGHPYDASQQMRRIGAQWKLVDTSG